MDFPGSSSQVNQPPSALPFDINNSPSDHSLDVDAISDPDENAIPTQEQQGDHSIDVYAMSDPDENTIPSQEQQEIMYLKLTLTIKDSGRIVSVIRRTKGNLISRPELQCVMRLDVGAKQRWE
ncbi:hypothetical protein LINPERPRIM_LOCUS14902 [Linum perenne]